MVTGATSGIGRALALELAALGATVGIVARDASRAQAVLAEMPAGEGRHRAFVGDLGRLADVRRIGDEVRAAFPRLDAVVHCAAVFVPRRVVTDDGLETMFATNYLSPFLLTVLLLPLLRASAPSRVLVLSAPSTVRLDFDDLQGERRFGALTTFGATKAAELLFVHELARRLAGTGVTVNAVHPGLVRTGLMRGAPAPLRWATALVSAPPGRAAKAIAPLALSPAYAERTGRFFKDGREIDAPAYTRDDAIARRLWDQSARLAGIDEMDGGTP